MIFLLSILVSLQVAFGANVKITDLPLGSASSSSVTSVMPYVDTTLDVTKKLLLSDLVNVPALSAPQFCTAKPLTGFSSAAGTVSASDSILTAFNKVVGNIDAISAASVTVGTFDSQLPAANGAVISTNTLYNQSATASVPGMVNTGSQTFAGTKTFANIIDSGLTADTVPYANSSKQLTSSAVTPTELGYVSGVTSSIQTQLNGKQASGNYITSLTGDVTASGPGAAASTIANNVVSNAKLATVATATFKGRNTSGTGNVEDLTVAQATGLLNAFVGDSGSGGTKGLVPAPASGDAAANKYLNADGTWKTVDSSPLTTKGDLYTYSSSNTRLPVGTNGYLLTPNSAQTTGLEWVSTLPTVAMPALTGDVTNSAGSLATTIANSAVTNAKMANMAQSTIKGRAASSGTGAPVDLSATQATAILDNFVGDSGSGGTKGLVPAPAAGDAAASKFLKADGTWATAGSSSPLTTKGDLYTYSTTNDRLPVGSNNQLLIPNSAQSTGLQWTSTLPTAAVPAFTGGDVTSAGGSLALTIGTNAVTDAKFRQSAGLSVVGRSANSTGNVADITASNDGDVLRRSGNTVGFGDIVLGALPQITSGELLANSTGATADVASTTLTSLLDRVFGSTQGALIYRGASAWQALGFGSPGYFLQTQGTGTNPQWAATSGAGSMGLAAKAVQNGATNCEPSITSASVQAFPTDTDCGAWTNQATSTMAPNNNFVTCTYTDPDAAGKIPCTINTAGKYQIRYTLNYQSNGGRCSIRIGDGTNYGDVYQWANAGALVETSIFMEVYYAAAATPVFQPYGECAGGSNSIYVSANNSVRENIYFTMTKIE